MRLSAAQRSNWLWLIKSDIDILWNRTSSGYPKGRPERRGEEGDASRVENESAHSQAVYANRNPAVDPFQVISDH